ncbi:MAG: hypothetical protein KDB53_21380, partial [Planctomycetes bacterium]|nr:hypothetical protein [Planctomycetota bacterium]
YYTLGLAMIMSLSHAQVIAVNTTLSSFIPVSGSPWVADVAGFVDANGHDIAIICRGNLGLTLYDVDNAAAPVTLGSVAASGTDLKDARAYLNRWIYCAQQGGNLMIVDALNPASPVHVASIPSTGGHNVFIDEVRGLLYYSRSGAGGSPMEIYDIGTSPTSPVLMSSYDPVGHNSHDAWAEGNRAYSFDIAADITRILDVTNPSSPIELATLPLGNHSGYGYTPPGGAKKILLTADERAGGGINIFDVTQPISSAPLDSYITDAAISVHNTIVLGRYAYISYYKDGLRIIDIGNPANPIEVGVYDTNVNNVGGVFENAWGVWPFSESKVIFNEMFGAQGVYVIDFTPPARIDLDVSSSGIGDFGCSISGLDPFNVVYLAISTDSSGPFGKGPFLGIGGDAIVTVQAPFEPFRAQADASGNYNFYYPGPLPPQSLDCVAISFKGAIGGLMLSNLASTQL